MRIIHSLEDEARISLVIVSRIGNSVMSMPTELAFLLEYLIFES